ncbi:MAG: DUF86 domain-containing protein [Deltaproteobacteria bacterium]|nr:DUF86 domain-containing protein [Deltaproteobacteria bacterium]
MKKDPLIYLAHILESIEAIQVFMTGVEREEFDKSEEKQSSVLWKLATIGEAAAKVPQEFRAQHPVVPWAEIVATRNVLIHEYFGVDLGAVWKIVRDDLPILAEQLKKIVA